MGAKNIVQQLEHLPCTQLTHAQSTAPHVESKVNLDHCWLCHHTKKGPKVITQQVGSPCTVNPSSISQHPMWDSEPCQE